MSGSNSLLDSIAHPTVLSPDLVDSYGQGQQIAGRINQNRLFQANVERGNLMRQATDADGVYHPDQFNRLAAGSSKIAPAMPEAIDQSTRLTTEQLAQAKTKLDWVHSVSGAAIDANDYSDTGIMKVFNAGIAGGMMTLPEVQKQLATLPPDAAGRKAWFEQHRTTAMSTQQQLELQYGKLGTVTRPDGSLGGYTQRVQSGAIDAPPQAGAPQGTSPETRAAETPVYKKMPDGTYQQVPEARSARPGASGASNQDKYVGLPNPLLGGLPNPAEAPAGGVAPPASPSLSAPPQGQSEQLAAGNKVYNDAAAAVPDQQKRLIAGESALQALDIASTGPVTGLIAKGKAFLEAQGITVPPQGTMSAVDYRQVLVKNLLRFAQDGSKGLGTNLGLEDQLHRNANADEMLPNANRHVLVQDLGILRRDLAQTSSMPSGAPAIDHVKTFSGDIDPRAFATKYMSGDEIGAMVKGMGTKEREKFVKSLETAHKTGHLDVQ